MTGDESDVALDKVLVIGGCGFLGSHIVELLRCSHKASISILSRKSTSTRPSFPDIRYYDVDITSYDSVLSAFDTTMPHVVIHTASPSPIEPDINDMFYKVNVEGTKNLLKAAQKSGVKAFIYTSSGAVIQGDFETQYVDADESWPVITGQVQKDPYSRSKAEAETLVLSSNDPPTFLTCSIRSQGIFGERDTAVCPSLIKVYRDNATGTQIGLNTNLFDFTYVGNCAEAHLLAAVALLREHNAYTSSKHFAEMLLENTNNVNGEAFFVTNDEPMLFWNFSRALWRGMGDSRNYDKTTVLSKRVALALAKVTSLVSYVMGKKSPFTRKMVLYCCMTAFFNNQKAKIRLGYTPRVGMEEAIAKTVQWFREHPEAEI